jgi:formate dehydrogenase major subunit
VLYSRASAAPDGQPWSERKRYVWWDGEKWTGYDVPDFPVDKRPDYVAPDDSDGMDAISGTDPFIMQADGRGWLFSPAGLLDGPLPTHYEPLESPVPNQLYPEIDENPAALRWDRADNPVAENADPRYPVVATTFRVTEQHTAGGMSRWVPWLAELQPEMFAEIDPELARQHGIEDGGWMTISSPRAEISARAKVTDRIKPLRLGDRVIHQVGLPWHWGFGGPSPGDSANDVNVLSGDPNVSIQESKAFVCNVRAGRTSAGTSKLAGVRDKPPGVAVNRDHPAEVTPHR